MKKLVISSLFILFVLALRAQDFSSGPSLGLKAGVNFSNIIKSGAPDFKSNVKPGLSAGLFVDIPILDAFSFAPELLYSQKGYQSSGTILAEDYDYKVSTNFLEVPLLAKFELMDGFHVSLGPQVSFLLSTTESFKVGSDTFRQTVTDKNKDLKKSLFGGVLGLSYQVLDRLGVQARYSLDFQKNNADGTDEVPEYKNQVFHLGLSYQF